MPQPRKYETRAQQQAAYRKRQALSQQELLSHKGLPSLPAIPTMPGNARWNAMIAQAQALLSAAAEEMQTYHDARSDPWQESSKAEELLAKLERLQEGVAQLQDIE
jgi:hypothetical protein